MTDLRTHKIAPAILGAALALAATGATAQGQDFDKDWTGPYGGVQLGYGDLDGDSGLGDADGLIGGAHLGYDRDFGDWVVGGEVDFDITDINAAGGDIDRIGRAKLRIGRDLGNSLVYATGGPAFADGSGSETGWVIGGGYAFALTNGARIGAEVLHHEFEDFAGAGQDASVTSITARLSFDF